MSNIETDYVHFNELTLTENEKNTLLGFSHFVCGPGENDRVFLKSHVAFVKNGGHKGGLGCWNVIKPSGIMGATSLIPGFWDSVKQTKESPPTEVAESKMSDVKMARRAANTKYQVTLGDHTFVGRLQDLDLLLSKVERIVPKKPQPIQLENIYSAAWILIDPTMQTPDCSFVLMVPDPKGLVEATEWLKDTLQEYWVSLEIPAHNLQKVLKEIIPNSLK